MKYALAGCLTAAIITGGMATGIAAAAPGLPLEQPAPNTVKPSVVPGQAVTMSPMTGSAECWSGIAPRTDPDCASGRYAL
ncbi:hypothetical protein D5S18_19250 [Nocardia panacis]|uniref:Uncharacterized protein n=1 Tax=Nocardia panacis TaxID=2340916 RepID=A0A3A4KU38_9NOCA|nr:hypothetical protein [Nocardia panacis]RJO73374.1 hypothetical protein D5S18_19250 [Nocardia panacis]